MLGSIFMDAFHSSNILKEILDEKMLSKMFYLYQDMKFPTLLPQITQNTV